ARVTRDLSERWQAEEALQKKSRELEQSNSELSQFAYVASHELKEPLRKIVAFGDLLAREIKNFSVKATENLQRIQDTSLRMSRMVDSLLDLSRAMSQQNEFKIVDLNDVLSGVLADLNLLITQSSAKVKVGPLPKVHADPFQMRLLFLNLLGNAL